MQTAIRIRRFGSFELDTREGELRKAGMRVPLQEQPRRLLEALLEQPGAIVGRHDLCRRLWPQGTFVDFEHSLNAAMRRLRRALGDDAEVPRFVETVHKRGYRFLVPAVDRAPLASRPEYSGPATIARIVQNRSRLAVLPFGPCDGFTDGLTEEALTQLVQSCPRSVGVIARTSVEHARRGGGGAAEIARALSADYLLEGHVRRDGDRLRITAQLIESSDETHLWASTFDRIMTDTLSVQSEVASAIAKGVVGSIAPTNDAR
jgi:TolB-like protein